MDDQSLRTLLRCWLLGAPTPPIDAAIVRAAAAHRLTGALYHIDPCAAEPAVQAAWAHNLGLHLERVALLESVWPRHLPPPLVFKGADLAEHVYDDPGARRCSDIDLLLPAPHFDAALAALAPAAEDISHPRGERFAREPPYEVGLRFGQHLIELHRHPQPPHRAPLTGGALYRRALPARLGRLPALQPEPVDRLLLWATTHAKQSLQHDLTDLLDLALLLRALPAPIPWTLISRRVQEAGLRRPFAAGLHALRLSGIWAAPLPRLGARAALAVARRTHPEAQALPFNLLKLWLVDPSRRTAVLARLGATAIRRAAARARSLERR